MLFPLGLLLLMLTTLEAFWTISLDVSLCYSCWLWLPLLWLELGTGTPELFEATLPMSSSTLRF